MNSEHLLRVGQGGLQKVCLQADDGATAEIYCHGAHVTSWRPVTHGHGAEQLFVSSTALFSPGSAIRGGVPLIFPQFADFGPLLKHGFARNAEWQLVSFAAGPEASALFRLHASELTRTHWPFEFQAEYQVQVGGKRLHLQLQVTNTDTRPFSFTAALHTYLKVSDVGSVAINGLQGLRYRDSAAGGVEKVETATAICIKGEVDRIYYSATRPIVVVEAARRVQVEMQGFRDAVVWNPGKDKGAALTDLEPNGFRRMLCIEAAIAECPIVLAPGESWTGRQMLDLIDKL